MNVSKYALVAICTLLFISDAEQCRAGEEAIQRVDIVSMHFATMTRVAWSFEHLWNQPMDSREIVRVSVSEPTFLRMIEHELSALCTQSTVGSGTMDTRIACLIYRENGRIDSISMSRSYTRYNDRLYPLSHPLVIILAEQLPPAHRDSIRMLFQKKEYQKHGLKQEDKSPEVEDE